jgi:DNA helicase II / ATP-dependent DNA helicase PcrA
LKYYQNKFKYIMVDEFQDTNWAQYELVKMLSAFAEDSKSQAPNCKQIPNFKSQNPSLANLMVVGDDNQAIYKFRGASLSNIMQFKDDYPEAKEVVLSDNYRSGQKILDSAYAFIKNNDPNTLECKLGINKKLNSKTEYEGRSRG